MFLRNETYIHFQSLLKYFTNNWLFLIIGELKGKDKMRNCFYETSIYFQSLLKYLTNNWLFPIIGELKGKDKMWNCFYETSICFQSLLKYYTNNWLFLIIGELKGKDKMENIVFTKRLFVSTLCWNISPINTRAKWQGRIKIVSLFVACYHVWSWMSQSVTVSNNQGNWK